ncbi:MAG TPA: hypothetical protein VFC39_22730 [Acidobacteriaceae bacterium]|nr:hypothetical protein [Acidobacteriaceae bacterium]
MREFRIGAVDQADGDNIIVDFSHDRPVTFAIAELMAIGPNPVPSAISDKNVGNQVRFYALSGS